MSKSYFKEIVKTPYNKHIGQMQIKTVMKYNYKPQSMKRSSKPFICCLWEA